VSETRIAALAVADLAAVTRIHAASFDDAWSTPMLRRILAMPGAGGIVARDGTGEDVVGFALSRIAGGECEILSLAVDPDHRHRGVGRTLLTAAIAWAQTLRASAVFLEVAEDNDVARTLYVAEGFEAVGRRPDYYRLRDGSLTAAITMRRGLAAGSKTST
jgi:ribosomal-protein-alanine N-acetyltransferase